MTPTRSLASRMDRRIRIERPIADTSLDGAGAGTWEKVGDTWAEVLDVLPSRGERQANGVNLAARPSRIRMRYRPDVTPDMRFIIKAKRAGESDRTVQIVSGPAYVENDDGIEFMVENYSTAGGGA